MKKSTGIISLVLTVAVTAGLLALAAVGVGENKTGAAKNIPLGLDLAGGVSITYQAKGETPSAEEMNDTIYKLQKRVEGYSTEAQVYPQGDDRINIEIPGKNQTRNRQNQKNQSAQKPDSLTGQTLQRPLFFMLHERFPPLFPSSTLFP
jgi:SecD/SecF fusion protein